MHAWKLLTSLLPISPAWWSMPHSMTKLRPLEPTYVVAFEAGQAMLEGVAVALLEETVELADELEPDTDVAELDCDAVLELTVEEAVEEVPPAMSLAPQMDGLLLAAPRFFFR